MCCGENVAAAIDSQIRNRHRPRVWLMPRRANLTGLEPVQVTAGRNSDNRIPNHTACYRHHDLGTMPDTVGEREVEYVCPTTYHHDLVVLLRLRLIAKRRSEETMNQGSTTRSKHCFAASVLLDA